MWLFMRLGLQRAFNISVRHSNKVFFLAFSIRQLYKIFYSSILYEGLNYYELFRALRQIGGGVFMKFMNVSV